MTYVDRKDVVVVGLGSMGSMALWQLAKRGADVLGIEQFGRVHTYGAYAGESRLFRVAAKEGEVFIPALLRSRELWQELGTAYGQDSLLEVGALSVGPRGHPALESTLSAIKRYDLPHEVLDAAELRSRYPQFYVEDIDIGVLDTLGGVMRSELAVVAATELALSHGASVRYDTAVLAIEPRPDGVRVVTSNGEVLAERVVLTAGPWTTRLLPDLADIVKVAAYSLIWFIPRHIEMFTPGRFPGFMRDLHGVHAFGIPSLDGYSLKATPSLGFSPVDDWNDRETVIPRERLKWAGEQIQMMLPDLIPEPSRWSVHGESVAASKMPVIDTVADGSVVVATALSGNGFKFSPAWGEMLADLATTGEGMFTNPAFTIDGHRAG
ncbi:MAG TPA: N-methyl-L-tryptophan oxidase [Trebonia sp.]|nr:N-methyl-L-tryptophan oxidase [Trebonia sp.]